MSKEKSWYFKNKRWWKYHNLKFEIYYDKSHVWEYSIHVEKASFGIFTNNLVINDTLSANLK